ncbi:FHA domain-containing serine/threonine-protein kinase [Thermogemmatispora carboxidivorans]|uniref:FHA domain-containing serine/threonine-protein kinase n=1 Tax=Thermogemmatispora carboxidivorans TaxID=1382306 RepID=UPI00069BED41|nr:FHA domain-containing serine/threonine-protein kinase [Thermogemmatispora carboxidivorans]
MQPPENPYARQKGHADDLQALVGRSLGQFRIVEPLGAGGMAAVFKAYQPSLDRYVAVKVLPARYAHDPVFVKRFEQEARSVAKLVNPHIVQIHDFGEQEKIAYIVMEYVDGGTLRERLKARSLSLVEAVDFLLQAAEGLRCAHSHNIVHRDVKPSNMLLRRDGHLLLSDFGIAKILEGTTHLTRAGVGIGTPQYMSPEQSTGQAVDQRSDIYSLGIVFFECLTGRVPFSAENPVSVTLKHLQEPLPVEPLHQAGVPAVIEQVVVKMTAKAPVDRYQSIEEMAEALAAAMNAARLPLPRVWRLSTVAPPSPEGSGSASTLLSPQLGAWPATPGARPQSAPAYGTPAATGAGGGFTSGQGQGESLAPRATSGTPFPTVTLSCFRCGTPNPSTRLFCTTCGYELADRKAAKDCYVDAQGRVVLASLTLQSGPLAGRSFRFHQDVTTIGRTNGNDFIIAGRTVSRRHARLWFDNGFWYLEDLQSANGTLVNGERIQQTVLRDGDVIQLGDERLIFHIVYKYK